MRVIIYSCLLICCISCNSSRADQTEQPTDSTVPATEVISATRVNPKTEAVAAYSEKVDDGVNYANNWKFAVQMYETGKTFNYLIKIAYKELRLTDSLGIPNFGIAPKVELRKGAEPRSCIIGFLDRKGEFKEYKKVAVKNEQLKITTINRYSVATYRTEGE
ncbi:MAG TPA: hypothetical protein VJ552_12455 [Sediminibacterium sp.]|nr:hypothetical protein [Sediminibacterium sp.]